MRVKKIILYTFFSIVFLTVTVVAGLSYRLIYQEKPIHLKAVSYNINIGEGKKISLKGDELVFSYNKLIKTFQLNAIGRVAASINDRQIAQVENLQVNIDLFHYFKSLTIPLDIKSDSSSIYLDNFPEMKAEKVTIKSCMLKLRLFINSISRNRFVFIRSLDLNSAKVIYQKQSYMIDFNSDLDKNNRLVANIAMNSVSGKSEVSLHVDNNKQIDTKLNLVSFPIEVLAGFIPTNMRSKYMIEAYNGVQLTGEIRYIVDSVTETSVVAAKLKNQRSKADRRTDGLDAVMFELTADRNFDNVNLSNVSLDLINSTSLKANAKIKTKRKLLDVIYEIQSNISLVNMPIDSLEMFWPLAVAPDVRSWLISSLSAGVVDKANCIINIEDSRKISSNGIQAEVSFSNLSLDYYKEHKQLKKLNGVAKFNGDEVKIDIKDGYVENAKIFDSTVEVKYSDKDLPLIINANTSGEAVNYLSYVDSENLEKIEQAGLDLSNIKGNLIGKIYLNIPLAKDIDLQSMILDVNANLKQAELTYGEDIKLTEGELNLIVDNKKVTVIGDSKVNMQPASIEWTSDLLNKDENVFDHKLVASLDLGPKSFLDDITDGKCVIEDGKGKIRFEYISYPKREAVAIKADLSDSEFQIPAINLIKGRGKGAVFTLIMNSEGSGSWLSQELSLVSEKDIEIIGSAEFERDLKSLRIFHGDFRYNSNSFTADYKSLADKTVIDIKGKRLDLTRYEISDLMKSKRNSSNINPVLLDLSLDKAQMPNDVEFSNLKASFACKSSGCDKGSLTVDLGENTKGSIELNKVNNLMEWKIRTNDAATFLRAFNIYRNITGGNLEIDLKQVSPSKSRIEPAYVGELVMTDFTATKTPILAKLISFSSFRGILSILQSYTTIPFRKMKSSFVLADDVLRVNNTYLTGDYLTLTASGVLDLKQKYINLYGKVVPPVYGLNYMLSLIPFIGHKLAGEDGRKGLIAANYKIQGPFDDARTFVNPMSMLIPEFFSSEIMELFIP